ncbi:MAG: YHS domain-containing protein [Candidatus Omnitrophica bacterium]|nr:YHS domain-containing protein [Candidatus Omnitrophota bacterium]
MKKLSLSSTWVITLSLAALTGAVPAFGQSTDATASATPYTAKAVNVGNKVCPVMGGNIDETRKATYEYQGKIYNFCCAGCIEAFKADPQKYIAKVEAELAARPVQP